MKSLEEVMHNIALRNNSKAIAEELNKPYSTFMREINPLDDGAKLAASALIPFTRSTGDFGAIDYIESALGRVAFELPKKRPGKEAIHRGLSRMIKEFADLVKAVGDSMADSKVNDEELEKCRTEGREVIQEVARMLYILEPAGGKGK